MLLQLPLCDQTHTHTHSEGETAGNFVSELARLTFVRAHMLALAMALALAAASCCQASLPA